MCLNMCSHSCIYFYTLSSLLFFSLTDSKRGVCNISGKYFSNNQTLVSICSVLLVVLQSLIWQHAALIWLSLHTTTKALNIWAPVSWTRNRMKPTKRDAGNAAAGETWERQAERLVDKPVKRRTEIKLAVGPGQVFKCLILFFNLTKKTSERSQKYVFLVRRCPGCTHSWLAFYLLCHTCAQPT